MTSRPSGPRLGRGYTTSGTGGWSRGTFSVIKRVFGEYVTARKFVNMAKEMAREASIYNGFIVAR